VRAINRLRATLLEYFPALERAFDYSKSKAALALVSEYATPDRLRRVGVSRLAGWLRKRGCRNSDAVAATAVDAAHQQSTNLPAERIGAELVARLAGEITAIDADLVNLDAQLTSRFHQHEAAEILLSLPGFGPVLIATFLANRRQPRRVRQRRPPGSCRGLAPKPYDSGRMSGNLHRPRRFNRRLLRTCYLAALSSLKNSPSSRAFHDRKRREGKSHKQALIALARRRINVIWAMLRDHTPYQEPAPATA
jgi:transposase